MLYLLVGQLFVVLTMVELICMDVWISHLNGLFTVDKTEDVLSITQLNLFAVKDEDMRLVLNTEDSDFNFVLVVVGVKSKHCRCLISSTSTHVKNLVPVVKLCKLLGYPQFG
eukprot:NODE_186_length_15678_cov_0.309262.p10 type:complete len:112 gc:universal NODE_186_length_15678_cov_0.309262:2375-2710(+)